MKSLAQNIFNLMQNDGISEDTLPLLQHLLASETISINDPVKSSGSIRPLGEAMRDLVEPGKYTPSFYRAETAQMLLKLDPWFFCQGVSGYSSALWLGELLSAWSRREDRDRFGFSSHAIPQIDKWACVAVQSLPESHRRNDALWKAALKLGLKETAVLLVAHRPEGWTQADEKGKPLIAQANGAWAWNAALDAGVDPHTPIKHPTTSKTKPLWRALLPNNPTAAATPDSLRAGVEKWVKQQILAGDASPAFVDYMRGLCVGRMGVSMGSAAWSRQSLADQVWFAQTLPSQWVNWEFRGVPAWLALASNRDKRSCLEALTQHPEWAEQIHKDPLSLLALDILHMSPKRQGAHLIQADTAVAVSDPRFEKTVETAAKIAGLDQDKLQALIQSVGLSARTVEATSNRPRPRM